MSNTTELRLGGKLTIGDTELWQVGTEHYAFVAIGSDGDVATLEARIPDKTDWIVLLQLTVDSSGVVSTAATEMMWPEVRYTNGTGAGEAEMIMLRSLQ